MSGPAGNAAVRARAACLAALVAVAWARASVGAGPPAEALGRFSALDSTARVAYLRRHAFSLDNFLEMEPGGMLVRPGPIGYDARFSRWGTGRGRARLFLNGILLNDPQNDLAPLAHTPTSGLGRLVVGESARWAAPPWMEGDLRLEESPAPVSRPHTFVELSKGTNDVRQRRVRFSSEQGAAGLDLAYDEVLDDGYGFDASGVVADAPDYGKANSRALAIVLRGTPGDDASYSFGLRRFRSNTTGDLSSATSAGTHDGHLLWLDAGAEAVHVVAYGRGYTASVPDSQSVNETVGGIVGWDAVTTTGARVSLVAQVERTRATMDVGAAADATLTQGTLTAAGRWRPNRATWFGADASAAGDDDAFAWGASAVLGRELGPNVFTVTARRSFRMPNLGERYLPPHARDGRTLAGDAGVDPEFAWEGNLDWEVGGRGFTNRVRVAWIRSVDAIAFRPQVVGSATWRVAGNAAESRAMSFVEERARTEFALGGLNIRAGASVLYTTGDREEAFASVAEFMGTASALVGGEMFEKTSALYGGAEFVHVDQRVDFEGAELPPFDVLNLILEGRLLDARLYVKYLNVLDEVYRTEGDYLMTPATFVYGIEWTLFD
jgi:TonB dependent receptor-like, beta-barrel